MRFFLFCPKRFPNSAIKYTVRIPAGIIPYTLGFSMASALTLSCKPIITKIRIKKTISKIRFCIVLFL